MVDLLTGTLPQAQRRSAPNQAVSGSTKAAHVRAQSVPERASSGR